MSSEGVALRGEERLRGCGAWGVREKGVEGVEVLEESSSEVWPD